MNNNAVLGIIDDYCILNHDLHADLRGLAFPKAVISPVKSRPKPDMPTLNSQASTFIH